MAALAPYPHENGSPDGCSEGCTGPHTDDPPAGWPESCPECGGNARGCYPACTDSTRRRPFESWEGQTGADSLAGGDPFWY